MSDAKHLIIFLFLAVLALFLGYLSYQFLMKNNFDYRVAEAVDSVVSVTTQYVSNEKDREKILRKVKEIRKILEKYRPEK